MNDNNHNKNKNNKTTLWHIEMCTARNTQSSVFKSKIHLFNEELDAEQIIQTNTIYSMSTSIIKLAINNVSIIRCLIIATYVQFFIENICKNITIHRISGPLMKSGQHQRIHYLTYTTHHTNTHKHTSTNGSPTTKTNL